MSDDPFYSIRMRSAEGGAHGKGGRHISGGEALAKKDQLAEKTASLTEKAFSHERGTPDFFNVTIEKVTRRIQRQRPLSVFSTPAATVEEGRKVAVKLLNTCGLSIIAIERAINILENNFETRGAIIIDKSTGERLDDRREKGVRVSQLDWEAENFKSWAKTQKQPRNERMKEALTIASKVCSHPATAAELCWSDDPDYITGYAAGTRIGYHRITKMKEIGDNRGGRLIFADGSMHLSSYIEYLETQPLLIEGMNSE
ncbi:6-carboxyhexanoate--CoA ligase [Alteribacillus sp. HJP-4]|uniref:6-carboxyhexanoate--CoA ligase n=1 Tax=Alteribacillus sp. HJP-4 TaxID=2775394 RepID=UPI0035CD333F